jgi:hypothetical protein
MKRFQVLRMLGLSPLAAAVAPVAQKLAPAVDAIVEECDGWAFVGAGRVTPISDGPLTRSILAAAVRQADTQMVRLFTRGARRLLDQRRRARVGRSRAAGLSVNRAITHAEGDLVRCQRTVADSREASERGAIRTEKFQGIVREIREDGLFVEEAPTYVGSVGNQHWTRTHSMHVDF